MGIQSRVLVGPNGETRRVQIGSKAETKRLSQGFKPETDFATSSRADVRDEAGKILAGQNTTAARVVRSSSSIRQEENQIKSDLDRTQPTSADEARLRAASDAYIKEIDNQIRELERQRDRDVMGINQSFDETRRQTEGAQENEKGATSVALARIGGFLGPSASGTGAMLNLAQEHRQEVLSLEQKRNAALTEANNAYNERRFAFVKEKLQEAKDIEKTILDRRDTFFNQTLDLKREQRQQDEFFRDKVKDQLETFGEVAISDDTLEIDPQIAEEIDSFYGVPGFTQQYLDVVRAGAKAESSKNQIENQQKLLNLLQDIPSGQTVRFPDGTEYTGMGSASDVSTSLQVDDTGIGRIVSYNKRTGQVSVTSVGAVGKTKGSGGGGGNVDDELKDDIVATAQIRLEDQKLEDGTYDPDIYVEERDLIKDAFPEMVETIDKLFLNPSYGFFNDDALESLRTKGVFAAPSTF